MDRKVPFSFIHTKTIQELTSKYSNNVINRLDFPLNTSNALSNDYKINIRIIYNHIEWCFKL